MLNCRVVKLESTCTTAKEIRELAKKVEAPSKSLQANRETKQGS